MLIFKRSRSSLPFHTPSSLLAIPYYDAEAYRDIITQIKRTGRIETYDLYASSFDNEDWRHASLDTDDTGRW